MGAFVLWMAPDLAAAGNWEIRYFYDVADWQFVILDLAFPTPERGIAVGYESNGKKTRPKCIVTRDGGRTWASAKIKEPGSSLFFLNDSIGWMVSNKGLWQTLESGRSWKKISKERDIVRVHFLDKLHGYAVGFERSLWETRDGGKNWSELPVSDEVATSKENTRFTWIEFAGERYGVMVGHSEPPRGGRSPFPDWMQPERAANRRQWPTSTVVVQTVDGGKSWKPSVTSMFGNISRIRLKPNGTGLTLVRFQHAFEYPSEVYRFDLKNSETTRAYRSKVNSITDLIFSGDYAYLAGFVPPGSLEQTPIPGRLAVLRSRDLANWEEMEVDYRANAHRVVLASAGAGDVWLATDTGMILQLTPP